MTLEDTAVRETSVDWLRIRQRRNRLQDLRFDSPDLFVVYGSPEPRCLAPTWLDGLRCHEGILVRFSDEQGHPLRVKHDAELGRWLEGASQSVTELSGLSSTDWRSSPQQLINRIVEKRRELGRPVRLALDISCCPKAHFLTLVATCLAAGHVAGLQVLYSSAIYKTGNGGPLDDVGEEAVFSRGDW